MGITQIAKFGEKVLGNVFSAATKPQGEKTVKGLLESKPVKGLLEFKPATAQTIPFKQKTEDIFETVNSKLFKGVKKKPEFSMTEMTPESMVLVHRTEYFPKNGEILSTSAASKDINGVCEYRPSVHFAMNKSVTAHEAGLDWDNMKYSIILPFKETVESMPKSKVIGGIKDDFFFLDKVKLPKGSVILKHNPDVPSGSFKISEAFDGVKLVETSSDDMVGATNTIIEKMGYTPYNKSLQKYLGATDKEMKKITSEAEPLLIRDMEEQADEIADLANKKSIYKSQIDQLKSHPKNKYYEEDLKYWTDKYNELEDIISVNKYLPKFQNSSKAWEKFCKEHNLFSGFHGNTPWASCETTLTGLDMLAKGSKSSWVWNGTDYKAKLLDRLNTAKNNLPAGKELGFDIDKMISIIKDCKTPEAAQKEVLSQLKIKQINVPDKTEFLKKTGEYSARELEEAKKAKEEPTEHLLSWLLIFG